MLPTILCLVLGAVADEATGVALVDDLNVRLKPSPSARVVSELRKGDRVTVRGFRGGFFEIDPPPGVVFFVAKKYVSPEGEVGGRNVRVRSAPSLAPSLIHAELPRGSEVRIVGEEVEWWRIRPTRDCRAYVTAEFVKLPEGVSVPGQLTPEGVAKGTHSSGEGLLEEPAPPRAVIKGGRKLSMGLSSPGGKLLRAEKIAALEKRRGRRADLTGALILYLDIANSEDSPAADRVLARQRLEELGKGLQPKALGRMLSSASRAGCAPETLASAFPDLATVEGLVVRSERDEPWTHELKGGLALRGEGFDLDGLVGLKARLWGRREQGGMAVYWGSCAP